MKFAFFGYDFMLPAVMRLIADGHELTAIFSFPCDNVFNFNISCQDLAGRLNIPFIQSPATNEAIDPLIKDGTTLFIAGGYPHKIPKIKGENIRAINIHPTALPLGRGIMPIPHLIINNVDEAAGFTAHKMTSKYDAGDILKIYKFDLAPDETVETYTAKISVHAPDFLADIVENIEKLWSEAAPQDESKAQWFAMPDENARTLNWSQSAKEIDAIARAFGRFGCLAQFDDSLWAIYELQTWQEKHDLPIGSVAARLSREVVVAVGDGFAVLKDFDAFQPEPGQAA